MPKYLKIENHNERPMSRKQRRAAIEARCVSTPDVAKRVRALILDEGQDSIPWDEAADVLDLLEQTHEDVMFLLGEVTEVRRQRDEENIPRLKHWQSVAWKLAAALQHISTLTDNEHDRGHARAALAETGFPIAYPDEWRPSLRKDLAERRGGEAIYDAGARNEIILSQEDFDQFVELLDAPAQVHPGITHLMSRPSPFESVPDHDDARCMDSCVVRDWTASCILASGHSGPHKGRDESALGPIVSWGHQAEGVEGAGSCRDGICLDPKNHDVGCQTVNCNCKEVGET